jgi:hypothetical protein
MHLFKLSQLFGKLKCHGLINYIDTKAKCPSSKKLTCQGTLRNVFICLRPPSLLGFCLGWSSNFVGSESGPIYSVKLLQNMVSNMTQQSTPPHSLPTTHCLYTLHFDTGKGEGRVEPERRLESKSSQSWVENTNTTFCIYTVETASCRYSHVGDSTVYKLW